MEGEEGSATGSARAGESGGRLTPNARPLLSESSTALSFEDATIFMTLVIFATFLVARMRILTAGGREEV